MNCLGNIVWLIFGGFLSGIGYIIGGLLIRAAPHFVIQIGVDGRPRGGVVGAMFTLPL